MTSNVEVQIAKIIADCCREARNAALEEAAKVIEDWNRDDRTGRISAYTRMDADHIRSLKEPI
jgi:hypothetical protein